jgi:hypothetical protein
MFSIRRRVCASAFGLFVIYFAVIALMGGEKTQAATPTMRSSAVISLDGPSWLLATDPKNVGREQHWWKGPTFDAKPTKTASIIQDVFPDYHGVAWYWRDFTPPANPHAGGRCLLRFWQVDYLADVWVNGVHVGCHEGSEDPFVFDVTDALKPGVANRVAIRVLNPTNEPIDGYRLVQTPRSNKSYPPTPGCGYNWGGIEGNVELIVAPAVRVEDLFVRPDPQTGTIHVQANVRNAGKKSANGHLLFSVTPATSGETLKLVALDRDLPPGDTLVEAELTVKNPRLWQLNDPYLYRVSAIVRLDASSSVDEQSTRCGFRDFRFEKGAFRLNGKRLFLKCSHSGSELPCSCVAVDPDMLRKDLLNCKAMGFNAIRFIAGMPPRYQLDVCDEIGLMVYEENRASWCLEDSPQMAQRFDHSTAAMVKRDRNHPCIAMWGLLNETGQGAVFQHAVVTLPLVRSLDASRIVMLNSGRFDLGGQSLAGLGSWNNSGVGPDPNVTFNTLSFAISAPWATWPGKQLALHPGPDGEFSAVRWIAPAAGRYTITALFTGIGSSSTTDVHVFVDGKSVADNNLTQLGDKASCKEDVTLAAGSVVMFVVGRGTNGYGGDTTALTAAIKTARGDTFTPADDFSFQKNPNGPWCFGMLKPATAPDPASFTPYADGRLQGGKMGRIGSLSNPGSPDWEDILAEGHPYQPTPHTGAVNHTLRTVGSGGNPYFLSEHGIGSAVDLARLARHFEQWQRTTCYDAVYYRDQLNRFTNDWNRWNLGDTFANPEDYFRQCLAWMANERKLDINAIRANPNMVGYSLTGTQDQGLSGEGLTTLFRELKPGTLDALFDAWYPLRWCLFVEPAQVYRGRKARFEAVLANEDMLGPGDYPVRLQVIGPRNVSVFDRMVTVRIPDSKGKPEPKFAIPVFADDVAIDGPSGKYRFLATFQKGAAAAGGDIEFYVADPGEMPKVEADVILWGDDPGLAEWLAANGIKTRPLTTAAPQTAREVILVGNRPAPGGAQAFRELARHIARGSHVVFLASDVLKKDDNSPTYWLPMANKGGRTGLHVWLYHKDDWAKNHPIFDGLPTGCILDSTFYREIIPNSGFTGQDVPTEVVAGAIDTACGYGSALTLAIYKLGEGRFTINTLRIRENLGSDPVAERLLRNMLRYAARDTAKPPSDVPPDFDSQLRAMGY